MTHIVLAYMRMAYVAMACIVMAHRVMASVVTAYMQRDCAEYCVKTRDRAAPDCRNVSFDYSYASF